MPEKLKNPPQNDVIRRSFIGDDGEGALRMASIDADKFTAEFVIATNAPVRDSYLGPPTSLSLKQGAVVLKEYRRNPVVFWRHDSGLIVGRSVVRTEDNQLIATVTFDAEDEDIGAQVWGKVKRGFVRAASVGYRVLRRREIEQGQVDQDSGFEGPVSIATQWRLVEWSVVAIGADGDALGRENPDGVPEETPTVVDTSQGGYFPLPIKSQDFPLL